jgi:hypothetical protein
MENEKILTICKSKSGKPKEYMADISWYDLMHDAQFETEAQMHQAAISLLTGSFLFIGGYTYSLISYGGHYGIVNQQKMQISELTAELSKLKK